MSLKVSDFNLQSTENTFIGSDVGDPFYISFLPLKRIVTLKAFIDSIKINTTKENEELNNVDKDDIVILEHVGTYDIDVTLSMPAGNIKEAYNNVAKIEELQKLASPIDRSVASQTGISQPIFKVWYRNLISNGRPWGNSYPKRAEFSMIDKCGFPCFIDSINYEPQTEDGFFYGDGMLFPKNIKLSLKLKYDALSDRNTGAAGVTINGFKINGSFSDFDFGLAPFGVRLCSGIDRDLEKSNVQLSIPTEKDLEYSTENVNELARGKLNADSYLFISLSVGRKTYFTPMFPRYVFLQGFLKSHSRNYSSNITYADTKETGVGHVSDKTPITFKSLMYSFSMSTPAANMDEAKRNCAKIQYILRMYYKAPPGYGIANEITAASDAEFLNDSHSDDDDGAIEEIVSNEFKKVAVFYPNFIESPGNMSNIPPGQHAHGGEFDWGMWKKSVFLHFYSFNFEIDQTAGYFVDTDGRLYPKSMTLNFEFMDSSGEKIKNYKLEQGTYFHMKSEDTKFKHKEHLFPFNRKTVKIGSNKPKKIDL